MARVGSDGPSGSIKSLRDEEVRGHFLFFREGRRIFREGGGNASYIFLNKRGGKGWVREREATHLLIIVNRSRRRGREENFITSSKGERGKGGSRVLYSIYSRGNPWKRNLYLLSVSRRRKRVPISRKKRSATEIPQEERRVISFLHKRENGKGYLLCPQRMVGGLGLEGKSYYYLPFCPTEGKRK